MDSSLVRKIAKAKDYAVQPQRVTLKQFKVDFQGDNGRHKITYEAGRWDCSCNYFAGHGTCSHTMAMELMLSNMVRPEPVAAT